MKLFKCVRSYHWTPLHLQAKRDRHTQRHSHTQLIFSQSHTKPQQKAKKKRFVLKSTKKKKKDSHFQHSKHIRPCQRRHQFLQGKMAFGDELRWLFTSSQYFLSYRVIAAICNQWLPWKIGKKENDPLRTLILCSENEIIAICG